MSATGPGRVVFDNLRRLARSRRPSAGRCELCSAPLSPEHAHLLDVDTRNVLCSCDACGILFPGQAGQHLRRIPRDVRLLPEFTMTDAQWDALNIPIDMAFFSRTGAPVRPAAFYPSPAGAVQSLLDLESWEEIVRANRPLSKMEDEVEALLVNRTVTPNQFFLVPIDHCYRLVGLIRTKWRGFSGGKEVWEAISDFFFTLNDKSIRTGGAPHA